MDDLRATSTLPVQGGQCGVLRNTCHTRHTSHTHRHTPLGRPRPPARTWEHLRTRARAHGTWAQAHADRRLTRRAVRIPNPARTALPQEPPTCTVPASPAAPAPTYRASGNFRALVGLLWFLVQGLGPSCLAFGQGSVGGDGVGI